MTSFPLELFDKSVRSVRLIAKNITSISSEIGAFSNLTYLALSANKITSLPPEIGNLVNVIEIYIYYEQITNIPPEIGNLVNLTHLYLYHNKITNIPSEIGNLVNLKHLSFHNNQITNIPSEIGNLVNLGFLSVHHNQITNIPLEIGNLVNLKYLFLYHNQISYIPYSCKNIGAIDFDEMNTKVEKHVMFVPTLYNLCCTVAVNYFSKTIIDALVNENLIPLDICNKLCNDVDKCDECGKEFFGGAKNQVLVAEKRAEKRIVFAMNLCFVCKNKSINK